jgi:hypothetical protein
MAKSLLTPGMEMDPVRSEKHRGFANDHNEESHPSFYAGAFPAWDKHGQFLSKLRSEKDDSRYIS